MVLSGWKPTSTISSNAAPLHVSLPTRVKWLYTAEAFYKLVGEKHTLKHNA